MTKAKELEKLAEEMESDTTLPLRAANFVWGEGNIDSKVVFVGEAPGAKEDTLKRPFVGRSGQLLDKLIGQIGWKREDVFITNIVKRRPPDNRDPSPQEIAAYKPYLTRQLELLNPTIVVTLGRFSMNYFLPEAKITPDQGKVFRVGDRFVVPMFHPAAALRSTGTLKALTESFLRIPVIIKKCDEVLAKKGNQTS